MTSPLRSRRFIPALAAIVALGLVAGSASAASAVTSVDGTLPLDLVAGSRLFGIEQYHPAVYEFTAGPRNTTLVAPSTVAVEYNRGATFDPDSGLVYYLTGAQIGCGLYSFNPTTSTASFVTTILLNSSPLTGCWGLTTMGGGTALLAAGNYVYDYNLVTHTLSTPRFSLCPGSSLAYDPSTGDLYSGKNNGELYRLTLSADTVTCDLVTTLVDVVDGTSENLKGFTFDTDGTMFLLSRWAPKLYSLTPADLTAPINYYGDLRFSPADAELPIDSLAMVYTPLPNQVKQNVTPELPSTGVPMDLIVAGGGLAVARRARQVR